MPDGISDLELFDVPTTIEYDPSANPGDTILPEARESMAKTNLIFEEYKAGVLDEREAGEASFNHPLGGMTADGSWNESSDRGIASSYRLTAQAC